MKIWFDGQCFQTASRNRGIGRYCAELLTALKAHRDDLDIHVSLNAVFPVSAITAYNALEKLIGASNVHTWQGLCRLGEAETGQDEARQVSELALVHHVNCLNPDIALSSSPFEGQHDPAVPLFGHPALEVPSAGIFYDAIPWRFPERYLSNKSVHAYYERRLKRYSQFDSVLAISEFSRREAVDLLGLTGCANISAGVSPDFLKKLDLPALRVREDLGSGFVLYVGALDWRKNVGAISAAIALLPEPLRSDSVFVLAGDHPAPLLQQLRDDWAARGLPQKNFRPAGLVSDDDLVQLYRQAGVVIQPSFMEGFGLTALEAISSNVPVLAARTGALPEVVGIEEWLFDPHSPADLASKLEGVLTAGKNSDVLRKRKAAVSEAFSWNRTAETTVVQLSTSISGAAQRPANEIAARRSTIAHLLRGVCNDDVAAANALALAEVPDNHASRLLIDATSTIHSQFLSGIQRVVRKICSNAVAAKSAHFSAVRIVYCDDKSGCFDTGGDMSRKPAKAPTNRIYPQKGDHVLALDSSWEFYAEQEHFLREARLRGARITSCIYDTVPIRTSGFCAQGMPEIFTSWLNMALTYSTGLMCISRAVADEVIAVLEAIQYPRAINVGYWQLGADFGSVPPRKSNGSGARKPRSFLMVGTLEPRKGYSVALAAFERLWARGVDVELVIAGRYGWGANDLAERIRSSPEYGKRLTWHQEADDERLQGLYADCDALIAASFAEGFGLPVVEAGYFGKPVIASDIPVFREVSAGARAATFFAVGNADSLASAVESFSQEQNAGWTNGVSPVHSWPDWAQSTDQLIRKLSEEDWYKRYEPAMPESFVSDHDIDSHELRAPIAEAMRDHRLQIVSPPAIVDDPSMFKMTVAVTNTSTAVWPGAGIRGAMPVCLSYHVVGRDGEMLSHDNLRTQVPLVMAPGDTQYMALYAPASWIDKGARYLDVSLLQERIAWWGEPVRVELDW